jgi:hypothetical protein
MRHVRDNYPTPDEGSEALLIPDAPDGQPTTVRSGDELNRVSDVSPQDLADGASPDQFETVDEADTFHGIFVVAISPDEDSLTLFDLRTELLFDVPEKSFTAHYGETLWHLHRSR